MSIKPIDRVSIHRITSGQVVIDLQTAVKELVENSLDAGATSIDVRFKEYGVKSIEVIDNGSGIPDKDYESLALKHHTSKLATYEDLSRVMTFGFRGEALSSLCALSTSIVVTTATADQTPMGTVLEFERSGMLKNCSGKAARQRGTTVLINGLFQPLPVRRKEFERNAKREFGKALSLLHAYALVPCTKENKGVRLTVSNHPDKGARSVQLRTDGSSSLKASITHIWGPKALDNLVPLDLAFEIETERAAILKKRGFQPNTVTRVRVTGLISKFALGCGRTSPDRQFFFVNGRPCNPGKVQKAFNEIYRSFNVAQVPCIIADFLLPTDACDINVSPDKRTIFIHSEYNLVQALKVALEEAYASTRWTFTVNNMGGSSSQGSKSTSTHRVSTRPSHDHQEKSDQGQGGTLKASVSQQDGRNINVEDSEERGPEAEETWNEGSEEPHLVSSAMTQEGPPSEMHDDVQASSWTQSESEPVSPARTHPPLPSPKEGRASPVPSDGSSASRSDNESPPRKRPRTSLSPTVLQTKSRSVQLVLETKGAVWNTRVHGHDTQAGRKRIDPTLRVTNHNARRSIRTKLTDFAMPGSQVGPTELEEEKESEAEEQNETRSEAYLDRGADIRTRSASQDEVDLVPDIDEENATFDHDLADSGAASSTLAESIVVDLTIPDDDQREEMAEDNSIPEDKAVLSQSEIIRTASLTSTLRFNMQRVSAVWSRLQTVSTLGGTSEGALKAVLINPAASISNAEDSKGAADELSRVIHKEDFSSMQILGQFNLGFIITRRRTKTDSGRLADDLFIVDQHAADEKFNFETLQQTTKIESQKLFRPRPLELTAAEELVAMENLDMLRSNGFEVLIDDTAPAGSGERVKLAAQPVSKGTTFDMQDLSELLHLMQDQPTGHMVRCSKARAMFAMRACRKSVMVGMPLTKQQLTSVVRHMGTMDQPWNCPHGRPTMRHLVNLSALGLSKRDKCLADWNNFTR